MPKLEQPVMTLLEPGKYAARIVDAQVVDNPFEEAKSQLQLTFQLLDAEVAGEELKSWANWTLGKRSRLREWVRNILFFGDDLPEDYVFDSDDLVDQTVSLLIVNKRKESDGTVYSRVEAIMAPGRRRVAQPGLPTTTPTAAAPAPTAAAPAAGAEVEADEVPF
jgi:hypothetical protein